MVKVQREVTPEGILEWAKLRVIDVYNGKVQGYTIKLRLPKDKGKALVKKIEDTFEEGKKDPEYADKDWSKDPFLGYKIDKKSGDYIFNFKTPHEFKNKKTETVSPVVVPIYDTTGEMIEVNIGNGSKGKVRFEPRIFHTSDKINGVSLRLTGVLVTDLVEFTPGGVGGFADFEMSSEGDDGEVW